MDQLMVTLSSTPSPKVVYLAYVCNSQITLQAVPGFARLELFLTLSNEHKICRVMQY